jgi:hypothetical protein
MTAEAASRRGPEEAHLAIERFLKASNMPAIQEAGDESILLIPGSYAIGHTRGVLTIEAWNSGRHLSRKITGIEEERPGRLTLAVEKFAKRTGTAVLFDAARAGCERIERRGSRQSFRERFRRFLHRTYTDWRLTELTTEPDLSRSLSPSYPRGAIRRGRCSWAVIAAPPGPDAAGVLTFGLIWLDYLRRRDTHLSVMGLILYLPEGLELTPCLRIRYLDPAAAAFQVYVYSESADAEVDPRDHGNLATGLEACRMPAEPPPDVAALGTLPGVAVCAGAEGSLSYRVNGLEFARFASGRLLAGLETKREVGSSNLREVERLAAELIRVREAGSPAVHPLYRRNPEAWLESQIRRRIENIDASLTPRPVYGQVPAMAGRDRAVLDLLAADRSGRLAVLEVKASEDPHLPLQALDYWMRVDWHARCGDFARAGYFRGIQLRSESPRLLLIAPALEFHPTIEAVVRFFSPSIEVLRIGVSADWRSEPRVMFRLGE